MEDEVGVPVEGGGGQGEVPEIELIIKASTIDGRRKGACLFLPRVFHGPLPPRGTQNHFFEGNHGGHAETTPGFPFKF